jgi:hypothetical protein
MTIEIKQLIIRAVVEEARARLAGGPAPWSQREPEQSRRAAPLEARIDVDAVVAECTRAVLRELRKGRGR